MSLKFVREFIAQPQMVGALWPSSPRLARAICDAVSLDAARHVLEIGPGTGVFTREILTRLSRDARLLAVEKNEALAVEVGRTCSRAEVVAGCATELADCLRERNFPAPEVVVSGLPWAAFGEELQQRILDQVVAVGGDTSVFVTFAYFGPHWLPKGRAFRARLEATFRKVERLPVVLRNLPPAFVYRASGAKT